MLGANTDHCCSANVPATLSAALLRRQRGEQRLRLLQIERVEAFGEPVIDRGESRQSRAMLIAARSSQAQMRMSHIYQPMSAPGPGDRRTPKAHHWQRLIGHRRSGAIKLRG